MRIQGGEPEMSSPRKNPPKSMIDNVNRVEPALDFSFYRIVTAADILEEEPRLQESSLTPRELTKKQEETEKRKLSTSRGLFLNNNGITDLADLKPTMEKVFENVDNVAWLNLSFNEIATTDPLLQLPNLKILYLHGNVIANLVEVEKLGALTKLEKATFHGNPVENTKGYRQCVLASLMKLKVLDFSNVTREDRTRINSWQMVNKSKQKKKKVADDE